jgi:hypothetical protein
MRQDRTHGLRRLFDLNLRVCDQIDPVQLPDHTEEDLSGGDIHDRHMIPGRDPVGSVLNHTRNPRLHLPGPDSELDRTPLIEMPFRSQFSSEVQAVGFQ